MNSSDKAQARVDKIGVDLSHVTFQQVAVRCSRSYCTRCPHGPYWYAYWRQGGKVRTKYIGVELPIEARRSYEKKLKEKVKSK